MEYFTIYGKSLFYNYIYRLPKKYNIEREYNTMICLVHMTLKYYIVINSKIQFYKLWREKTLSKMI